MINDFSAIGNLGTSPILTMVEVDGEPRKVANMRVYFDRPVGQDFKDKGGFWLTVDIWGYRAEEAVRVLKKSARVFMKGTLRQESWTDEADEVRSGIRLTADYFFIDSMCVESIQYREKKQTSA
jgi:single-strand DNA-binding protein